MKRFLIITLVACGIFSSCKTDFDVNAPYKEIMVIYGFLNTRDTTQYIRISKAYLGIGNALVMAQQKDSINYANVLTVTLTRIFNGSTMETTTLNRIDTIPKDDGVFASPYQVYYTTNHHIDQTSNYLLTVRNNQTGTVATSLTTIVNDIQVLHPPVSTTEADFATPYPYTVDFHPGINAKVFDLTIRFHYTEIDSLGVVTQHYVDWDFSDQLSGDDPVKFRLMRPDFYKVIGSQIEVKPGVTRRVDNLTPGYAPVEYRFIAGTEDLLTYQQLLAPSTGIAQEKPLFTTIENGVGLFTSRLIHSQFMDLSTNTKLAFDTSAYTNNLNFHF